MAGSLSVSSGALAAAGPTSSRVETASIMTVSYLLSERRTRGAEIDGRAASCNTWNSRLVFDGPSSWHRTELPRRRRHACVQVVDEGLHLGREMSAARVHGVDRRGRDAPVG